MNRKKKLLRFNISFFIVFLISFSLAFALPAFPGAEGFGAETVGGRGGVIYEITNLANSGTGSLRSCVEASGPRICIFKVGGTITLSSALTISNPYITIAGQTAPGGGILLRNSGSGDVIHISTHDVVIRYLTLRRGPPSGTSDTNDMAIYNSNGDNVYNIIIDHCSMSWSNDRILFSWYGARDFSIQWSLFTEPLRCNRNTKGCVDDYGAKSVMLGSADGTGAKEISFHHNLIAHGGERNPLVKPAGITDIINNIVYDVNPTYAHMDADKQSQNFPINYIGNYFRQGPSGSSVPGIKLSMTGSVVPIVYVEGNIGPKRDGITTTDETAVLDKSKSYIIYQPPHEKNPSNPAYPVTVDSCDSDPGKGGTCEAYNKVVIQEMAGNNRGLDASGNFYVRKDAVDKRIFAEVKNKQGKIIDAPGINTCWEQVNDCSYLTLADYTRYGIPAEEIDFSDTWFNGWPIISSGTPYTDSDHDGMSDTWESAQGLNPNDPTDGPRVRVGHLYTNVEEYLNGDSGAVNLGSCTESDWAHSDGVCQSTNTLTRTWTKLTSCIGGVTHPSTETVSCTYVQTRQIEDVNSDGSVNINDLREVIKDLGKTSNFINIYNDVNSDNAVNLKDIVLIAKAII